MKIALIGYGKMGRAIETLALAAGDEVVLRIDKDNEQDLTVDHLRRADVAIEFSRPEAAFGNIKGCLGAGVPVVCGTTGWLENLEAAKAICQKEKGAMLYASNFSVGVNLFFAVNRYLAQLMEGQEQYNVVLEEIHHTQKLDAPSGTAITLAEGILAHLSRKQRWVNREEEKEGDLSILSQRIDQVPGTHTVAYSSPVDTITLRHEAHSREGFARGALQAARWIIGKQGVFEMKDMLGF